MSSLREKIDAAAAAANCSPEEVENYINSFDKKSALQYFQNIKTFASGAVALEKSLDESSENRASDSSYTNENWVGNSHTRGIKSTGISRETENKVIKHGI